MLDSELQNHESDGSDANGKGGALGPSSEQAAVPAAVFQAPQVLFQPPAAATPSAEAPDRDTAGTDSPATGKKASGGRSGKSAKSAKARSSSASKSDEASDKAPEAESAAAADAGGAPEPDADDESADGAGTRRRKRRRSRGDSQAAEEGAATEATAQQAAEAAEESGAGAADEDEVGSATAGRRRRRKRRRATGEADSASPDDPPDTVVHVREAHSPVDDVRSVKGSTRLEAKKQRRREGRESGRRRPPIVTESEFLARRESVERVMVVRQRGDRTQIAVLEDGVLVEHYVNRTSHQSYVGNVYLGKVQNVLPSMEAAFVDVGKGRNAVLYAGEVNFDASGLEGQPKRIESALKSGQSVIVQVTKDPVGHKGARLTSQVSLPGRYLVYVPGASMTGISRKLPDTERNRLKQILKKVMPDNAGVIVRTAAEGATEDELANDVARLAAQWEQIERKAKTASAPALLYGEPDLTIRVVRDVFNEDFSKLIVSGDDGWEVIDEYVRYVAPHLTDRLVRWPKDEASADEDVFAAYRVDEQLGKALDRKVWLPSGGSLVIDRTEAMTVVDVNTGKFTGQGGNLEETVTRNNLEAAEEIVRQLRLRDVGGIVVIDFIDMVLESNRELVLRRLLECLARDRTKHQVAEVTSLGLVQMTRKRVGAGLLEAFSEPCECCNGRGVILTLEEHEGGRKQRGNGRRSGHGQENGNAAAQDHGRGGQDSRSSRKAASAAKQLAAIHNSVVAAGADDLVSAPAPAPVPEAKPEPESEPASASASASAKVADSGRSAVPVRRTRGGTAAARLATVVTSTAQPAETTPPADAAPSSEDAPSSEAAPVGEAAAEDAPSSEATIPENTIAVQPGSEPEAPSAPEAPSEPEAPPADEAPAPAPAPAPVKRRRRKAAVPAANGAAVAEETIAAPDPSGAQET